MSAFKFLFLVFAAVSVFASISVKACSQDVHNATKNQYLGYFTISPLLCKGKTAITSYITNLMPVNYNSSSTMHLSIFAFTDEQLKLYIKNPDLPYDSYPKIAFLSQPNVYGPHWVYPKGSFTCNSNKVTDSSFNNISISFAVRCNSDLCFYGGNDYSTNCIDVVVPDKCPKIPLICPDQPSIDNAKDYCQNIMQNFTSPESSFSSSNTSYSCSAHGYDSKPEYCKVSCRDGRICNNPPCPTTSPSSGNHNSLTIGLCVGGFILVLTAGIGYYFWKNKKSASGSLTEELVNGSSSKYVSI